MDAARAGAAAIVVISHSRDLLVVSYDPTTVTSVAGKAFYFITGFGHSGVVVFFVLSGFWISKTVMRRTSEGGAFWRPYLIDRLSRLWIVLLPALLFGGALDLLGLRVLDLPVYHGATGALSVPPLLAASLTPQVFAGNLLFLQRLALPVFGSNAPLWSLAYEFWYYLWFPALWLAVVRRRPGLLLVSLAMGLVSSDLVIGFLSWCCGFALNLLDARLRGRVRPLGGWTVLLAGALVFFIALALARSNPTQWVDPLLALGFAAALLGLCLLDPPARGVPNPIARFGAGSSFSLYAIHYPLVILVAGLLTRHGRLAYSVGTIALVFAMLLGVCTIAWLFSRATEARTANVRRYLLRVAVHA